MTSVSPTGLRGRLRRMSFRQRLIYLSATAVAAAVVLASVIVFAVVRGELRGQVDEELRDLVEQIAIPTQLGVFSQENGTIILPSTPLGGSGGYAQIVQPDGTVLRPEGRVVDVPVKKRTLDVARGESKGFSRTRPSTPGTPGSSPSP